MSDKYTSTESSDDKNKREQKLNGWNEQKIINATNKSKSPSGSGTVALDNDDDDWDGGGSHEN